MGKVGEIWVVEEGGHVARRPDSLESPTSSLSSKAIRDWTVGMLTRFSFQAAYQLSANLVADRCR
jgi:hypothetical protein